MGAAIVTLGLASMGRPTARSTTSITYPDYAGRAYSQASSVLPWEFVPGRNIVGESCGLSSDECSNDERVTG